MSGTSTRAESPEDFGQNPRGVAARWIAEIRLAEQSMQRFWDRGARIEARYLDERREVDRGERRFNIFWSNVQTLKPAVYAKPPKPIVQRRYLDADPVGRAASTILQRAIATSIEMSDWHETTSQAVDDYLVPGRGTCWVRYEPHFRDIDAAEVQAGEAAEGGGAGPMDMGAPEAETEHPEDGGRYAQGDAAEPEEDGPENDGYQITNTVENPREITYEEVCWDYVHWQDLLHNAARIWQEVRWVGRRVLVDRDEGVERFGEMFRDVPMTWAPDGVDKESTQFQFFQRAVVYEIWDKPSRKVYWICPDCGDYPLDVREDPLMLADFFPCPRPLSATTATNSVLPRADFVMYQDQAELLDELEGRIARLSQAIKAVGVYDAAADGVQRVFNEGVDNQLIPVPNWAAFAQGGGFKGAVDFLPLDTMAQALAQLALVKEATKRDLYEITGISDIVRGQGMASATATAERIKGQFAQLRLRDRVQDVARFCRDMVRMTGELICKHFEPQTLMLLSDYQNSTGASPELAQAAIALLKNDQVRGFRIDIEVDSTVIADQQEEQESRVAFLQMAGNFLREAVPLAMQVPALGELAGQMLLFGIRGFPVGREMESVFETALQQLAQAQQNPQPKQPTPEEIDAQTKAQVEQQRLAFEAQKMQADDQFRAAELQLKAAQQQLEERKVSLEEQRAVHERDIGMREQTIRAGDLALKSEAAEQKRRAEAMDRDMTEVTAVQQAMQQLAQMMGQMGQQQQQAQAETMQGLQTVMKGVLAPRRAKAVRGPDGRISEAVSVPEGV